MAFRAVILRQTLKKVINDRDLQPLRRYWPKIAAIGATRSLSSKRDYESIDQEANDETPGNKDHNSVMAKYGEQIKFAGLFGGGSVVFYGISRLFYDVTYQFLSLTPAISLKYGFYGGALTAFGMAGAAYGGLRGIRPDPESAFSAGMSAANYAEDLRSLLGGSLSCSAQDIKLYKSRGGSFGVVNGSVSFKTPKCELVFTGSGPLGRANVVVIYSQKLFAKPEVEFVGADVVSTAGKGGLTRQTRVVVVGSADGNDDTEWAVLDRMLKSGEVVYKDRT
jgi:hypothetical protein